MLGHFRDAARGVAADPDQRLSALPLLAAPERQRLLTEWNDDRGRYPRRASASTQLFEAQAARTPDAVARRLPSAAS